MKLWNKIKSFFVKKKYYKLNNSLFLEPSISSNYDSYATLIEMKNNKIVSIMKNTIKKQNNFEEQIKIIQNLINEYHVDKIYIEMNGYQRIFNSKLNFPGVEIILIEPRRF